VFPVRTPRPESYILTSHLPGKLVILKLLEQLQEPVPAPVLSTTSGAPEKASRGTSFQMSSVTEIGNTIRLDTTPRPGSVFCPCRLALVGPDHEIMENEKM
jgi:hypothetical protein